MDFSMLQWTSGHFANFTTCKDGPWIPILKDVNESNVEFQDNQSQMAHLTLFKKVMIMREWKAFHSGKVYYPLKDKEIFSFLR